MVRYCLFRVCKVKQITNVISSLGKQEQANMLYRWNSVAEWHNSDVHLISSASWIWNWTAHNGIGSENLQHNGNNVANLLS